MDMHHGRARGTQRKHHESHRCPGADLAPIVVIAACGAWWIAAHAGGGRAATHTLWQSLTLTEITVALLLRGRKPAGALAGILAAYLIFDLPWLTLPPMLFALLTVAAVRDHRMVTVASAAAAAVITAVPYLHGGQGQLRGIHPPPPSCDRGGGRRGNVPETGACPCRRPGPDQQVPDAGGGRPGSK
jgi:hypothetical protein